MIDRVDLAYALWTRVELGELVFGESLLEVVEIKKKFDVIARALGVHEEHKVAELVIVLIEQYLVQRLAQL